MKNPIKIITIFGITIFCFSVYSMIESAEQMEQHKFRWIKAGELKEKNPFLYEISFMGKPSPGDKELRKDPALPFVLSTVTLFGQSNQCDREKVLKTIRDFACEGRLLSSNYVVLDISYFLDAVCIVHKKNLLQ